MKDTIHELIGIGLTEYEARVYSALLQHSLLNAKEISKIGGIPRGRVYDTLDQLAQKGFCIVIPGAVKKFKATEPETAIHNLIELRRRKEQQMIETAGFLQELYDDQDDNESPLDFVQVYTTANSIMERFSELTRNTERIVRSFCTAPYAKTVSHYDPSKAPRDVDEMAGRNVLVKVLWEVEEDNLEEFVRHVHAFVLQGEEARIARSLPMKVVIYDESSVFFIANKRDVLKKHPKALLVQNTDLTDALIELFEYHWEDAVPFDEFVAEHNLQEVIERGAEMSAPGAAEGGTK